MQRLPTSLFTAFFAVLSVCGHGLHLLPGCGHSHGIAPSVLSRSWQSAFRSTKGLQNPGPDVEIRIENDPHSAPDTVVLATSGAQRGGFGPPEIAIGQATPTGDFHSHVDFLLGPNHIPTAAPPPELGAYGTMLSVSTEPTGDNDRDGMGCLYGGLLPRRPVLLVCRNLNARLEYR